MCGSDGDIGSSWLEAIIFGFMITNLAIKKFLGGSPTPSDRGEKVIIWPRHIQQKDINDMVLVDMM